MTRPRQWTAEELAKPALRPYGDRGTSVGEAVQRAAEDLGIERNGRSFEEFAGLVDAAVEAPDGKAG